MGKNYEIGQETHINLNKTAYFSKEVYLRGKPELVIVKPEQLDYIDESSHDWRTIAEKNLASYSGLIFDLSDINSVDALFYVRLLDAFEKYIFSKEDKYLAVASMKENVKKDHISRGVDRFIPHFNTIDDAINHYISEHH